MNKLLSLILLLSLSLAFYSCGSDDDDEPQKFVWGGDWNDPDDPNYKPEYKGKYNPIQGLWRRDSDKERGLLFTEDFKCYTVVFYGDNRYVTSLFRDKYIINDKAYRYHKTENWKYKLENGKFWNMPTSVGVAEDDDWRSFTKVKEKE